MLKDANVVIQILAGLGILAGGIIFLVGLFGLMALIEYLFDELKKRKRNGKWHRKFALIPTVVHTADDGEQQVVWFRQYEERFIEEKTKFPPGDNVLILTTFARRLPGGPETKMSNIVSEGLYD